jgi:site-specific recombinase XerC
VGYQNGKLQARQPQGAMKCALPRFSEDLTDIHQHRQRDMSAMHLLQSNVDLNMIRSWFGHASIETTHGYVEIDLEMKRKTLQSCEKLLPNKARHSPSWQRNNDILSWLSKL